MVTLDKTQVGSGLRNRWDRSESLVTLLVYIPNDHEWVYFMDACFTHFDLFHWGQKSSADIADMIGCEESPRYRVGMQQWNS